MAAEFAKLADITVASVKVFHGVKGTETGYDDIIAAQLRAVISYVQIYCGHDFESKARVNESPYVIPNERHFYIDFYPVASVQSLVEVGLALTQDLDYYIDLDAGRVEKIDIPMNVLNPDRFTSAYWSIVRKSIFISYTGGIALDDNMISVVKELTGIRAGIKKRTYTDNTGIQGVTTINKLSDEWQMILDQYRRRKVRHLQNF